MVCGLYLNKLLLKHTYPQLGLELSVQSVLSSLEGRAQKGESGPTHCEPRKTAHQSSLRALPGHKQRLLTTLYLSSPGWKNNRVQGRRGGGAGGEVRKEAAITGSSGSPGNL